MLRLVRMPEPERRVAQYPHQLSGGMRQRVMIAMALACEPRLLIADEPTTALDVTIQAQILDLMRELKERTGAAIMLITHDLGVVAEMAQRVVVMYAGRKVEEAPVDDLFARPRHPYTRGLLDSMPQLGAAQRGERRATRLAEIPASCRRSTEPIVGCAFAPRCAYATDALPRATIRRSRRRRRAIGPPAGSRSDCSPEAAHDCSVARAGRRRCSRSTRWPSTSRCAGGVFGARRSARCTRSTA